MLGNVSKRHHFSIHGRSQLHWIRDAKLYVKRSLLPKLLTRKHSMSFILLYVLQFMRVLIWELVTSSEDPFDTSSAETIESRDTNSITYHSLWSWTVEWQASCTMFALKSFSFGPESQESRIQRIWWRERNLSSRLATPSFMSSTGGSLQINPNGGLSIGDCYFSIPRYLCSSHDVFRSQFRFLGPKYLFCSNNYSIDLFSTRKSRWRLNGLTLVGKVWDLQSS